MPTFGNSPVTARGEVDMFKTYTIPAALVLTAGMASAQTEREPSSPGKTYVGCVEGSAARGYTFSVPPAAGASTTKPKRYGLLPGKMLMTDLAALVNKRAEIVATLAEETHTFSASSSAGGSNSTGGNPGMRSNSSSKQAT